MTVYYIYIICVCSGTVQLDSWTLWSIGSVLHRELVTWCDVHRDADLDAKALGRCDFHQGAGCGLGQWHQCRSGTAWGSHFLCIPFFSHQFPSIPMHSHLFPWKENTKKNMWKSTQVINMPSSRPAHVNIPHQPNDRSLATPLGHCTRKVLGALRDVNPKGPLGNLKGKEKQYYVYDLHIFRHIYTYLYIFIW